MTAEPTDPRLAAAERALKAGAYDQAIEAYEAALEGAPANLAALRGIAQAYRYFNRNDRIAELFARAAKAAPKDGEIQAGYVEALIANSEIGKARQIAEQALAAHPDLLQLQLLLAHTDMIRGDQDAARAVFWDCLEKHPDAADCTLHLADIAPDGELERLNTALQPMWAKRDEQSDWDAATLGYAYGKAAERQKDFGKAWEGFSFGARKKRSSVRFDETTYARTHDLHRRTFARGTPSPHEADRPGEGHIFIVSLPRSGTTLVEQILDAHEKVEAIGERSLVYDAVTHWTNTYGPDPVQLFSSEAVAGARSFYTQAVRELVEGADTAIVDKSITNYLFLGFLRTILPGARFLHTARHPLDTAVSCFTTLFFGGNEWTYDLSEMGRNIRRHQQLMTHWIGQWPDDILTVSYEALVADPEPVIRNMISFCGLSWDPACLEFYSSRRPVMTASLHQVRQPIYSSAMGRAENYQSHLAPLIAAMGRRAADPNWHKAARPK